jgi:O-antigen/teichoic acid export membrane protein
MDASGAMTQEVSSRFATAVGWYLLATLAGQGATFLASVVVARMIGPEQFGQLGIIQTTVVAASSIAQLGMGITATKYVAELRYIDSRRAGRILSLVLVLACATGGMASVLLLVAAEPLAARVLSAPDLESYFVWISAAVLFQSVNAVQAGALAGLQAFRGLCIVTAICGAAQLVLTVVLARVWGLHGAVAAVIIGAGLRVVAYQVSLAYETRRQGISMALAGTPGEIRVIAGFAVPSALSGLSTQPAQWASSAMLANQPEGFVEVGLYSAANALRTLVLLLPGLASSVATSFINQYYGLGHAASYRQIFRINLAISVLVVLVAGGTLAATATFALSIFGEQFTGAVEVLMVLMVSAGLEAAAAAIYQIVQSKGRMWLSFFAISLPRDVLLVTIAWWLVPQFGALGLAAASAASWLVCLGVIICVAWHLGLGLEHRTSLTDTGR